MKVQNSKTIRRQIAETERGIFKPYHRLLRMANCQAIPQETLDRTLESHNNDMRAAIERGDAQWAGFYAQRAVNYYLSFRAYRIADEKCRAIKTAFEIARRELYDGEGISFSPISTENGIGESVRDAGTAPIRPSSAG